MAYETGRLIDHVGLRARDFPAARRFWRAVLEAVGRGADVTDDDGSLDCDELYVGPLPEGAPEPSRLHLCLQAPDRAAVDRFHAAGLAAGGRDHGAPGLRDYHPGYYAAFLLDPDGNVIEAKVDERVTRRSAPSVRIETG